MDLETQKRVHTYGDKKLEYTVYKRQGSWAIEEAQALQLAEKAGIKGFKITSILPYPDLKIDKVYNEKARKNDYTPSEGGIRWVALCEVPDADGNVWVSEGSAGIDNVSMGPMKSYCPEIACKRARVRVALLALGLKDLNADIEFPEAPPKAKPFSKESIQKLNDLVSNLGLDSTDGLVSYIQKFLKDDKAGKADLAEDKIDDFVTFAKKEGK